MSFKSPFRTFFQRTFKDSRPTSVVSALIIISVLQIVNTVTRLLVAIIPHCVIPKQMFLFVVHFVKTQPGMLQVIKRSWCI